MSKDRVVSLKLSEDLLLGIGRAARAAGCSPQEIIRDAVAAALTESRQAELAEQVGHIRGLFDQAEGWLELQSNLRSAGFVLRAAPAGGLGLHTWPQENYLIPAEALGQSLAALSLRFRAPFPGLVRTETSDTPSVVFRHRAA